MVLPGFLLLLEWLEHPLTEYGREFTIKRRNLDEER